MTTEEAQMAINQPKDDHASIFAHLVGSWGYTMLPFCDSRGGNVLHFWPNEKREKIIRTHRERYDCTSVCGLSTKTGRSVVGAGDLYNVRKMRKCKKCLHILSQISVKNNTCDKRN